MIRHATIAVCVALFVAMTTTVTEARVTFLFEGTVTHSTRPDISQPGDVMQMQFSVSRRAMNVFPDPKVAFTTTAMFDVSASIEGVEFADRLAGNTHLAIVRGAADHDFVSWQATSISGQLIKAYVRLPAEFFDADPKLDDVLVNDLLRTTGGLENRLTLCVNPVDCIQAKSVGHYRFAIVPDADRDGDGITDEYDNCTSKANADQRDSNGDGIGNACDADVNNDCQTNFHDLSRLIAVFLTDDADSDFNGDGIVSFPDVAIFSELMLTRPGPSEFGSCT